MQKRKLTRRRAAFTNLLLKTASGSPAVAALQEGQQWKLPEETFGASKVIVLGSEQANGLRIVMNRSAGTLISNSVLETSRWMAVALSDVLDHAVFAEEGCVDNDGDAPKLLHA